MARPWLALLCLAACATACGSPSPAAYGRELEQAGAARRRGEHLAAAEHYERAARAAEKPRDVEEARYRAADSYARGGKLERAQALYDQLAAQAPDAERRARADFALAELAISSGHEAEGQELLVGAIRRNPSSGLARRALSEHLGYLQQRGGVEAVLSYLKAEGEALAHSELAETLAYQRARVLDQAGQSAEARDAYLACAAQFPYPAGAYWDDALYRAAEKEQLGAAERALQHLSRLLAQQEDASIVGSYQRGRYAEAQLLIAQIYRDQLHDPARARRELRKVRTNHHTSRLVDDALFQEALLARAAGDQLGTCSPLHLLTDEYPDSRYAPCAHLLCSELAEVPGQRCHDYIKRDAGLP